MRRRLGTRRYIFLLHETALPHSDAVCRLLSCRSAAFADGTRSILAHDSTQNHGLLVATTNIEATLHFFVSLEKSCQVQLAADAAAAGTGRKTRKIPPKQAALTHGVVGTMYAGYFNGLSRFQLLEAEEGVSFDVSRGVQVYKAKL